MVKSPIIKHIIIFKITIILFSISNSLTGQSLEDSYQLVKVGGMLYAYNIKTSVKRATVRNIGLSYEFKKRSIKKVTFESWFSFIDVRGVRDFGKGYYFGVQANWYPLNAIFEYDVFRLSSGLAYFNGQRNYNLIHEGIGITFGPGFQYLIKKKLLVFAEAKFLYYYDWEITNKQKMLIDITPIIVGLGYRLR